MNKRRAHKKENNKESRASLTWPGLLSKIESISSNPADFITKHAFLLLLIAFLALTYIWVNNNAQATYREINQLEKELEEMKWEYTSRKAEFMFKSKQSEVAKKTENIGLEELIEPALKIDIVSNEH